MYISIGSGWASVEERSSSRAMVSTKIFFTCPVVRCHFGECRVVERSTMAATAETVDFLNAVRSALCPNETCRSRLLFRISSSRVRCRICSNVHPMEHLLDVLTPRSSEQALQWAYDRAARLEKLGDVGLQWRMISRTVDGVNDDQHMRKLYDYFECFGVQDGRVKRLSEMGRKEPINIVNLSDYAFAIRNEHVDLAGYGKDYSAAAEFSKTIKAIQDVNEKAADVVVPLVQLDETWMWDGAAAISKACVGREIFWRILRSRAIRHMKMYGEAYQKKAGYTDSWWREMVRACDTDPTGKQLSSTTVDLAVFSNMLRRPILLLRPELARRVEAFVPFMSKPEQCRDRRGGPRSPLVLALASTNSGRKRKVAVVATAGADEIQPVLIPRDWFKSVWGLGEESKVDTIVSQYFQFDSRNRCAVASGIYFKPEVFREIVVAFDNEALKQNGVHPLVDSDFTTDVVLHGLSSLNVMEVAVEGLLWRCMRCGRLNVAMSGNQPEECSVCEERSRGQLRKQLADGTIEYKHGDHTITPAPESWCFLKRKHFYGEEYDNPPITLTIGLKVYGSPRERRVMWFSGESNNRLNSNGYELAAELVHNLDRDGNVDFESKMGVASHLEEQIRANLAGYSMLDHKMAHLKEWLGVLRLDQIFDDAGQSAVGGPSDRGNDVELSDEAKSILAAGVVLYDEHRAAEENLMTNLGNDTGEEAMREHFRNDSNLTALEEEILDGLKKAITAKNDEERWRVLRTDPTLFEYGGFYHTFAYRHHRDHDHFMLPLLGNRKFAFCSGKRLIALCVKGAGHFRVTKDVDDCSRAHLMSGSENQCAHQGCK